jgi:anaerobic magnesium-protoporphyrin IX monomethyl ester cyclase
MNVILKGFTMRILLIHPPSPDIYQAFLPLGLAYIAGSLLQSGHEVAVWDINAERPSRRAVLKRIRSEGGSYELVGISGLAGDYPFVAWLSGKFKKIHPGMKIVLGGYLASALPGVLMERLPIDFVVVGEGEETMVSLAKVLSQGADPSQVKGLYFRDASGRIGTTPPGSSIKDLDRLPLPPWDYFPMDRYLGDRHPGFGEYLDKEESGLISLMASRGCPFGCIYCDHTVKGYRPRYRSVEKVIEEIEVLLDRYGRRIKTFYFWDDILIWDREWIIDFCRFLLDREIKIRWTCNGHVNRVEPEVMRLMKEAGCENVRFGIESGSQRILDALNKGVRVERALEALRTCLDAGLTLTLYLMVGMTGESEETIEETARFFKELVTPLNVYHFKKIHFFMLTPFPGTRLYDSLRKKGLVDESDDFLRRDCDAWNDIPLNISGRPDRELRMLKTRLEDWVSEILTEETNRLHGLLINLKGQSTQS